MPFKLHLSPKNVLTAAILFLSVFFVLGQKKVSEKPNVILILTDDQGWADVNCYGAKDLHTPNMDKLAREGVRFTQFYAAASVCSPSRASMLTGLNPHAAGLPGNASSTKGEEGMPSNRFTLAEMMKQAGYATGHVGKWHLGYTPETMPNGQGFDYSYGHMGGCIDNYSHFFYWHGPNRHDLWENGTEIWADGKYFPDLMATQAETFIDQHKKTPFFLYYAINLPHYPLQPDEKWRNYYNGLESPRKEYAAFVSTIDERIGKLLKKLEDLGLRENTIIIFQSDHGYSKEERTFGGGGSAGPFRGAKFSLFEGGIRVPAIISWKGHLPENTSRNQMALNIDWFPTIAELCGITAPVNLEGRSLVPILKNNTRPSEHQTFIWQNNGSWAVRKDNWKLIGDPWDSSDKAPLDPEKDKLFLANMAMDSTEMTNLATQYPEKVVELRAEYTNWPYSKSEQ
ncbi:sulfatase-like hydrolase/transferase [Ulvibacterium sp.]|uniref:sulfatase family protein n=1 Tax=Ulvibacterium sp. TaxID=2665914 RepID=UPI00260FCCA5|nr:sulfatase-like hydrolase/transferase [Ulvibacterium sp.]